MLSIIVSTPSGRIKAERLHLLFAQKIIFPKDIVFSCVCDFFFFLLGCLYVVFFCGHDNSWKAQVIRTKFTHMTFNWNSLAYVTPLNGDFFLPSKLTYLRFQPIQTKFSHETFDWNNSSEFENGHRRSNVTHTNGGFCSPPPPPRPGKFKYLRFWWNWNHMQ